MLPDKLELEIVTPERRVVLESVDEVLLPGSEGYLGVRPGHVPLLTSLEIGETSYRVGDDVFYLALSGGFVEVLRDRVSILAETAERAEEIDLERAERARQQAETEMKGIPPDGWARAGARLRRAATRIQVHAKRR